MTTVQPKERPILFSGPMVRAILDGKKTQTRRIVKLNNWRDSDDDNWPLCEDPYGDSYRPMCKYGQPGDRLWVRETFCRLWFDQENGWTTHYRADDNLDYICEAAKGQWKPSIFMPRNLSRITLQITDVCVERLQEISEQDAVNEGVSAIPTYAAYSMRDTFQALWTDINGSESWDANPWVWVVSFKVVK